jgi:two-component system LytT family sensor kinase
MHKEVKLARWRRTGVAFALATLLGLFFATKFYYGWRAAGMPTTWTKHFWWQAMEWYSWVIFLPGIFWICRKLERLNRSWKFVALHLAAGIPFALLHCAVLTTGARVEAWVLETGKSWLDLTAIVLRNHFHSDLFTYAVIVTVWHALEYYRKVREHERTATELEKNLALARLQALRTQLQPHFLFNTLNSITTLNHDDPKAANRMIARLSELLRMSLESDGAQEVPLSRELDFLHGYLDIQRIRFGERLTVHLDADSNTLDALVPNLLLQPLVENAICHGIAPFSKPGEVRISARRDQKSLYLQVSDSGPGMTVEKISERGRGVGLANTRARLQELYGHAQRFDLANGTERGFRVEVRIPFVESRQGNTTPSSG